MKPDWTVLDAGAHIGYYALQEARRVKRVIAVEPIAENLEVLKHNIHINNITNVETMCIALGDTIGVAPFNTNCHSNLCHVAFRESSDTVGIPMTTVDELFSSEKVDYIRMDVEGFSFNILKGAEKTIKNNDIGMFIEVHRDFLPRYGGSLEEMMNWADDHQLYIDRVIFRRDKFTRGLEFVGKPRKFIEYLKEKGVIDKWGLDTFWMFLSKKND
jgi:FkbM family methyltransferase